MINEPVNKHLSKVLALHLGKVGKANCLLGSKEFIRLDKKKDSMCVHVNCGVRVHCILEMVVRDCEESLKNSCEKPFLSRKSLNYLSKSRKLLQRNERQESCFLGRDARKKAIVEGPDMCGHRVLFHQYCFF